MAVMLDLQLHSVVDWVSLKEISRQQIVAKWGFGAYVSKIKINKDFDAYFWRGDSSNFLVAWIHRQVVVLHLHNNIQST